MAPSGLFRAASPPKTLNSSAGYVPFARQPATAHYVIQATLEFTGSDADLPKAGFRVRASADEWTDVYFDPQLEAIVVERQNSSLITTCEFPHAYTLEETASG